MLAVETVVVLVVERVVLVRVFIVETVAPVISVMTVDSVFFVVFEGSVLFVEIVVSEKSLPVGLVSADVMLVSFISVLAVE